MNSNIYYNYFKVARPELYSTNVRRSNTFKAPIPHGSYCIKGSTEKFLGAFSKTSKLIYVKSILTGNYYKVPIRKS